MLGLRFCARAFSRCDERGPLFIAVRVPLLLRSTGSRRAGSVVVAHGPSCSTACGILPDQGSNPCSLHWQADSQPLHHQGSPQSLVIGLLGFPVSSGVGLGNLCVSRNSSISSRLSNLLVCNCSEYSLINPFYLKKLSNNVPIFTFFFYDYVLSCILFIYLFLAALGLRCCARAFL